MNQLEQIEHEIKVLRERLCALHAQVDAIGVPDGDSTLLDAVVELQQGNRALCERATFLEKKGVAEVVATPQGDILDDHVNELRERVTALEDRADSFDGSAYKVEIDESRLNALIAKVDAIGIPGTLLEAITKLQQDSERHEASIRDHRDRLSTRWKIEGDTRARLIATERLVAALVRAEHSNADALTVLFASADMEGQDLSPGGGDELSNVPQKVPTFPGPEKAS